MNVLPAWVQGVTTTPIRLIWLYEHATVMNAPLQRREAEGRTWTMPSCLPEPCMYSALVTLKSLPSRSTTLPRPQLPDKHHRDGAGIHPQFCAPAEPQMWDTGQDQAASHTSLACFFASLRCNRPARPGSGLKI